MISNGKTATAANPSQTSVISSQTADRTSISTTLHANGSGFSTWVAASASTPARVMTSPVRCWRCHGTGCRTTRSMTSPVRDSVTRHVVRPANMRRPTTPIARTTPTRISSPSEMTTCDAATLPSSNRGTMSLSMMRRTTTDDSTVHEAYTAAHADGGEEQPLVVAQQAADEAKGLSEPTGIWWNSCAGDRIHVYWFYQSIPLRAPEIWGCLRFAA